ncbi:MAG TPA: nickel-dependent hydrogenase large subunit [Thermoleophilia bacterium]|nr:nickel-dependent hydrogenase large subunit [Thermoleophilia bacterium]
MAKVVIDPVTRIEGHLRVEVEVENGKVVDAWATSTMFRGLEMIVENRPWMDAWHYTHRVCGVCPTPHGHNSAMALENAAGISPPPNGRLMRNLLECAQLLHDHVLWFYILNGLDYVNVVSALSAKASSSGLKAVQDRLKAFVDSGQLGFLENGYWDHPAYALDPELNLQLAAHYLESIKVQAVASEASALFGGKFPYQMSTPPGGFASVPHQDQIDQFEAKVREVKGFIDGTLVPDLMAIAPFYLDQAGIGAGHGNYFTWGVIDEDLEGGDPYKRLFPRGGVFGAFDGNLSVQPVDQQTDVREWVTSSWNTQYEGGLHPWEGVTGPDFTGIEGIPEIDRNGRYAWEKSAHMKGAPVEVGPLAQMLVAYLGGPADHPAKKLIDDTLAAIGHAGNPAVLFSNLGRIAARVLKVKIIGDKTLDYIAQLRANMAAGDMNFYTPVPDSPTGQGFSGWDAPRGSLAHWATLEDGRVKHYQIVTPSGWNFAPRAGDGRVRGPVEQALVGTPVADPERPLEVLRTLHSFDP